METLQLTFGIVMDAAAFIAIAVVTIKSRKTLFN